MRNVNSNHKQSLKTKFILGSAITALMIGLHVNQSVSQPSVHNPEDVPPTGDVPKHDPDPTPTPSLPPALCPDGSEPVCESGTSEGRPGFLNPSWIRCECPEPSPEPTPTPEQTPEPTPTPEPSPSGCEFIKVTVTEHSRGWTAFASDFFSQDDGTPSCLQERADAVWETCSTHAPNRGLQDHRDDCFISGFVARGGSGYKYANYAGTTGYQAWEPNESYGWYSWGVFLDASCQQVSHIPDYAKVCSAKAKAILSPLSLILEETNVEHDVKLVKFAHDPSDESHWTLWKASSKAPLLVFDPLKKRSVSSGAELFGSWTFGGQSYAALGNVNSPPTPWKHGYEPLRTLDSDGNGALEGEELKNLALWFDENRDGISQPGEVKGLDEVDITKVYVTPDGKNEKTGAVTASIGFDRVVDGEVKTGRSVDWFTASSKSALELAERYLHAADILAEDSPLPLALPEKQSDPEGVVSEPVVADHAVNTNQSALTGLWAWEVTASGNKAESSPGGLFVFGQDDKQRLTGYSIVEAAMNTVSAEVKSVIRIAKLDIRQVATDRFTFEVKVDEKMRIRSQVSFTSKGALEGKSEVFRGDNSTPSLSYNFSGRKLKE